MLLESLQTALESTTRRVIFNAFLWLASGLALLVWRLWRFTITPRMKPSEPKELPYWIPYLGHIRSFFKDYNGALEEARVYFNDSKEPYSVWIAGTRIYICSSPDDVASLYRNTTTISYHNVIKDMYRWIGVTEDGFNKMFTVEPASKHNIGMPHPQAAAIMINEYHRRQTKPGELFDDLLHKRFIPGINLALDRVANGDSPAVVGGAKNATTVSLLGLCTDVFLRGTTTAFLGQRIWEVNPRLLDSFALWERTNWKYMFQMPNAISGDMLRSRDGIIDSFVKYLKVPVGERTDSNDFTKSVEAMMRDVGCCEQDMARIFMLHFWAVLGNIYKVAFWTMAHLAYDPKLLDTIRAEAESGLEGGHLNESYIAENCPLLESLISENLRLTVATALVRDVVAPTQVNNKILQPGTKVLVPYRQLHGNRSVWGEDPYTMKPARFADDPKLYSSKSYRPFGGGHTLCPGRFMAKRTMAYTIAAILTRFEVSVDFEPESWG
ncbi:putative Cytochrome P450 [Seiridium unicorne]|uniref:Cytochrome P450 n=1 Tax=Seiridium unicorne TaxID=138068 RepID=A0ABR2VA67_9PEZI